jgi:hypothetical protein
MVKKVNPKHGYRTTRRGCMPGFSGRGITAAREVEMKRCKWLWSMLVVMVVLSMSISPASAQDEPVVEGTGVEPDGIWVDLDAPKPLSPIDNHRVYTKTPKFLFTRHPEATNYRVIVYPAGDSEPLYAFPGPAVCVDKICSLKPTYALKTFQYTGGGAYKWQAEAYIGGHWQNTSPFAYFYVLSKGFTSTFDLDTKRWTPWVGTWTRTNKGFYKTEGEPGIVSTTMQNELFEDHIVYQARMKRKVETEPNYLLINGSPEPLFSNGTWGYADVLEYSNSGTWRFLRSIGGSVDQLASGASPYIVPFGWNTWTIWADYPHIYVWVNEVFVTVVTETNPYTGYVGIGMYKSGSTSSPLLVDYAKLNYSGIYPMEIPGEVDTQLE